MQCFIIYKEMNIIKRYNFLEVIKLLLSKEEKWYDVLLVHYLVLLLMRSHHIHIDDTL